MALFLISFLIMAIAVLAMSLGVILGNKRIKGSCGGLAALGIERVCDCPNPCAKRKKAIAALEADRTQQVVRFR